MRSANEFIFTAFTLLDDAFTKEFIENQTIVQSVLEDTPSQLQEVYSRKGEMAVWNKGDGKSIRTKDCQVTTPAFQPTRR
jgi:hypothetical protein